MPQILTILVLLSSLCLATAGEKLGKADSLYQAMTPLQRVQQLILVQGQNDAAFGGVYHEGATEPMTHKTDLIQLEDHLNPFSKEPTNLPNLYTLAAITQEDVVATYLHFFERMLRAQGVNKCIVPIVEDSLSRAFLFTEKMKAHNPDFFLGKEVLSFETKWRKKHLMHVFEDNEFWVVPGKYEHQVNKKLEKYAERILSSQQIEGKIKAVIAGRINHPDTIMPKLSNQLAVAISKGSVIPLQKKPGIFPLKRDTICFLTNNPFGTTANLLRKYTYVLTTYEDILQSKAPVVIDEGAFLPSDDLLKNKTVIYTGTFDPEFTNWSEIDAALVYPQTSEVYRYVIPQQLFGASDVTGKLPMTDPRYQSFYNLPIKGYNTLGYAPEGMVGLEEADLKRIQDIIEESIQTGCTPGGQLAVAVDGAIILDQAFGYLTYDSLIPTERSTLYDLASVTKVSGTLLAVMKLYEEGKLNLDTPISQYLPAYSGSNKETVTSRALLSHNAGLLSYVPFWQNVLRTDLLETFYYENEAAEKADKRSYNLKPNATLRDTLNNWIIKSALMKYDSLPTYRYSDIGFMILHQVVEAITGQPINEYLKGTFYQPLGLKRLTFNPLQNGFQRFEIAPTEHDYYFRDELVWGEVHDRNAAVFGGVAGHAGLFANAGDLTVILQTLLQGGAYGGVKFLEPETIDYFNHQFYPNNRRALGWDKKDEEIQNVSLLASLNSFGHTGFTGTIVWVDPRYNLSFVYLSNRIHPNANNYKLISQNIRTRLQDVIYEALLSKWIN